MRPGTLAVPHSPLAFEATLSTLDTLTSRDLPFPTPRKPELEWMATVLWSFEEPERIGEVLVLPGPEAVLGRGAGEGEPRLQPMRVRPGWMEAQPPLAARRLSRRQLRVRDAGDTLELENLGRTKLQVHGGPVQAATLRDGDVFEIHNALVCRVSRRVLALPELAAPYPEFPFGEPDPFGIVGESPATWKLRADLAFVARRQGHALVHGPSGAGKELAARALHRMSDRSGPFVARNAATFPGSLIDAELFGNCQNYPNPGMAARPGLIGEADGGTLLLDELSELPHELQAHLLRVLDDGEYQRLGDSRQRRSDLVFIGLTNRAPDTLKHDLRARLRHAVAVPGLGDRREDVPLIARALLLRALEDDPELLGRFFDGRAPRMTPRLVTHLVQRPWATHVRELDTALWERVRAATESFLDIEPGDPPPRPRTAPVPEPDADAVRDALQAEEFNVSATWRRLGLRNRDQLRRLMKRYGIERT